LTSTKEKTDWEHAREIYRSPGSPLNAVRYAKLDGGA
jgi:hypothetical protein